MGMHDSMSIVNDISILIFYIIRTTASNCGGLAVLLFLKFLFIQQNLADLNSTTLNKIPGIDPAIEIVDDSRVVHAVLSKLLRKIIDQLAGENSFAQSIVYHRSQKIHFMYILIENLPIVRCLDSQ